MVKRWKDLGAISYLKDGVKSTVWLMNSEEMRGLRDSVVDGLEHPHRVSMRALSRLSETRPHRDSDASSRLVPILSRGSPGRGSWRAPIRP